MSNYATCKKCGAELHDDDRAIHRKLILRNADEFFCIDCLAEYIGSNRKSIEDLIEHYRELGICTLFR